MYNFQNYYDVIRHIDLYADYVPPVIEQNVDLMLENINYN